MDNEDAQSTDWLDSTNHNVVAVLTDQVGDPWNHPLMMIDHYHAAEEASKRVSLDATETWMTDQDGDDIFLGTLDTSDPILMAHHHHDGEFAALPSSISFQPDDNDLHLMSMDDGDDHHQYNSSHNGISHSNQHDPHHSNDNDDWSDDSWNSQFRERRAQLAASMQASQSTRNLISKHVQTRASLQQVLQEIEKSATQVRQHIVETVGMAVDEPEPEQQEPNVETEPMPDVEPSNSSSDGNVDNNGITLQVATEPTAAAAAASNQEKPAAV